MYGRVAWPRSHGHSKPTQHGLRMGSCGFARMVYIVCPMTASTTHAWTRPVCGCRTPMTPRCTRTRRTTNKKTRSTCCRQIHRPTPHTLCPPPGVLHAIQSPHIFWFAVPFVLRLEVEGDATPSRACLTALCGRAWSAALLTLNPPKSIVVGRQALRIDPAASGVPGYCLGEMSIARLVHGGWFRFTSFVF